MVTPFQGIGFLGTGTSSTATGVSGDGSVVVGYATSSSGYVEAFSWTGGTMLGLGALPYGITSWAYGTNYDGSVVVGMSYYGTPSDVDYAYQAFAWNAGTMTGLPFLSGLTGAESEANAVSSNGAVVVGWSQSSEGATTPGDRLEAFRWSGGTIMGLGYLPGGYRSVATATNADGSIVVGWGNDATDHTEAFLWTTTAGITGLGFLSGGIRAKQRQ